VRAKGDLLAELQRGGALAIARRISPFVNHRVVRAGVRGARALRGGGRPRIDR
jgi:hypothetical protein